MDDLRALAAKLRAEASNLHIGYIAAYNAMREAAAALDRLAAVERDAIPREPTQAMIAAGRRVVLIARLPDETPDQWIARFFTAMYDAAIAARKGEGK